MVLVVGLRRGLGLDRAIRLAKDLADDRATGVLGDEDAPEWLGRIYDVRPTRKWRVEITPYGETHWRLKIREKPRWTLYD